MNLPNNHELLNSFTSFLSESGLSAVSIKNYLSDIRHYFRFLDSIHGNNLTQVFQNPSKYINKYIDEQKSLLTPLATTNRRLASIRRFATFLKIKFQIISSENLPESYQNASSGNNTQSASNNNSLIDDKNISSKKILDQFRQQLINEKKTHSTVKNYLSDLYHYFSWIANQTPYNTHHLAQILSTEQLQNYISYQKLTHTSTSVINRRQSSIKKLTHYCFAQGFIPTDPFEVVVQNIKIAPLSWLTRFISKPKSPQNASKSRLAIAYNKYNSLPFTPYLHLALLVLATTTMAILGYNQIIKQARPSSAATALTSPRRQLSFQGRLTDSAGTPISTAVNLNFKLWDQVSGGTETTCDGSGGQNCLYKTGTCSITPDQDGIFNSLIGDGVCGTEIPQSVFTDHRDLYLAVTVGAETLTPRQQIATVGYALNSETLQGYPASSAATINTVPVVDNSGNITIGASSPSIVSTSGNFNIKGQSLSLTTALNSGGDIVIQPDALGSGQILALGGTSTEDSFRITNANLTTGSLLSAYIGNDTATTSGRLLTLTSGATETERFSIRADGSTAINTATNSAGLSALIINQGNSGANILSASSSGVTKFTINNAGGISFLDGVAHTIDDVAGNLTLTSNSSTISLNDNVTFAGTTTLNGQTYTWPASQTNTYVLSTNGAGTLSWVAQTGGGTNYWNQASGALYPLNSTVDFLLGGQASSSAKFAVLNMFSGTPTASISGTTTNVATFIDGNGNISSTNRNNLTLGNSTTYNSTGNILLNPNGTGTVGIGTTSPNYKLDINGILGISRGIGGTGILNGKYGADLTSAIQIDAGTYYGMAYVGAGNNAFSMWQEYIKTRSTDGTTKAIVQNEDEMGTFNFYGDSGTAIRQGASIRVNVDGVPGANDMPGRIAFYTTPDGSSTTLERLRINNAGNVGIGTTAPAATLSVGANLFQVAGATGNATVQAGYGLDVIAAGALNLGNVTATTIGIGGTAATTINIASGGTLDRTINIGVGNSIDTINIGTGATGADVINIGSANAGNVTIKSNAVLNLTGSTNSLIDFPNFDVATTGDITVANQADIRLSEGSGGGTNYTGFQAPATLAGDVIYTLPTADAASSGYVLSSNASGTLSWVAQTGGTSYWNQASGALYPLNSTVDFLLGGQASSSAKFAVLNMFSGTPTASISGTTTNVATFIDGNGNISSTNRNNLTLGNSTTYNSTGNILLNPNGTGTVGIGTTNPTNYLLHIAGVAATAQIESVSSSTSSDPANLYLYRTKPGGTQLGGNEQIGSLNFYGATGSGSQLTAQILVRGENAGAWNSGAARKSYMAFTTGNGFADTAERMRITGAGNLGIGTTAPAATLSVGANLFQVAGATGNATVQAGYGLDVIAAGALNLGNATATTIGIGGTAATTINIASGGTLDRTINIGVGNSIDTINIGTGATGADVINIGSANAGNVTIKSNAVLNLTGSTNSLIDFPNFDVATTGNVTVAAGNGIDVNASGELALGNTTATTIGIGGTAATTLNIGAGGNLTRAFNLGTGTGVDTINIGTGATGADVINIGSANAGAVSLKGGTNSLIDFPNFDVATTGNVTVAAGNGIDVNAAGELALGNTTATTIGIGGTAATTINIASGGTLNRTINIGVGNSIDTINIGTGATGADVITIGGGVGTLAINTSNWDISSLGVATSFTGFASSGTINFSGLSASSAVYTDGSSNLTSVSPTTGTLGFWQRSSGSVSPWFISDAINLGNVATSSALVHLTGTGGTDNSFFMDPVAIGFNTAMTNMGSGPGFTMLQVDGDILPKITDEDNLGSGANAWQNVFISQGISDTTAEKINIASSQLKGTQWNVTGNLRVGDTVTPNAGGIEFYVAGDTQMTGTLNVGGAASFTGSVSVGASFTVGGGTGKIDVGTVDPPYTINGEKYATYMAGMVGVKEEVTGNLVTSEYIEGLGYRKVINFNSQEKGSDLWLFGKTTNIKQNLSRLSVLLSPQTQTSTWYELDENTNTLYIYSSTPTNISFRLTAPRFDNTTWANTRSSGPDGFVLNDPDNATQNNNIAYANYSSQISNIDGVYKLFTNNVEKKDSLNLSKSLIANLKAGIAVVNELVADNLTVNNKLISPLADIGKLTVNDATVSGNLYADNIKSKTIDKLSEQLDILGDKYSTASAILANLQEKYTNYDSLFGQVNSGTSSANIDPLTLSPLATTSAYLPSDLSLNSLNVQTLISNDILANGSIFSQALNSFDTDLFIQSSGEKPVHILANLMTLYPNGQVAINGDLIVTGNIFANNIDTRTATVSGTLAVGKGELATDSASILALFNNNGDVVGSVDASGSAKFGELSTNGLIIASELNKDASISGQTASNSTVGTASIATGSAEIVIANNKVTADTLIYITPVSDTSNQVLYVKSKQVGTGFTVAVPQPVEKETAFNFWLVQTK